MDTFQQIAKEAEEEDKNGNSRMKTNASPINSGSSVQGEEKAAAKPEVSHSSHDLKTICLRKQPRIC